MNGAIVPTLSTPSSRSARDPAETDGGALLGHVPRRGEGGEVNILAFDLGTRTGWSRNLTTGQYVYGTLDLRGGRYAGGGMRYVLLGNELVTLLHDGIDLVVYEEVRRHLGVDAAHVYGGLLAVLTAACEKRKIPYQGVPVQTIKKHATTKGNADKAAMIAAASTMTVALSGLTSDEADAICLLDYAVKTYKETPCSQP